MKKKKSKKRIIHKDKRTQVEIPIEGSLGLLALGAVGIKEWRKVRDAHKKNSESE